MDQSTTISSSSAQSIRSSRRIPSCVVCSLVLVTGWSLTGNTSTFKAFRFLNAVRASCFMDFHLASHGWDAAERRAGAEAPSAGTQISVVASVATGGCQGASKSTCHQSRMGLSTKTRAALQEKNATFAQPSPAARRNSQVERNTIRRTILDQRPAAHCTGVLCVLDESH